MKVQRHFAAIAAAVTATAAIAGGLWVARKPSGQTDVQEDVRGPTLRIVREGRNVSLLPIVKAQRDSCIAEKQNLQQIKRNDPGTWAIIEPGFRKERPNYKLDGPIAPEPDWAKVGIEREEEYFSGKNYALYTESAVYEVPSDGICALTTKKELYAEIDDGRNAYALDLTQGTGLKQESAALVLAQNQQQIVDAVRAQPELGKALGDAVRASGLRQGLAALAQNTKTVGREIVAGQSCDRVQVLTGDTELCLWSKMHEYPGRLGRPIVLKSTVVLDGQANVTSAVEFQEGVQIDSKKFQPPPGIKFDGE